jgi:secreted trypsin-like serine protease
VTEDGGTCKCGIKKTRRIIGGTETTVNEYPWIAAFDFNGVTGTSPGGCAATLISTNWAVTASHCFYDQEGALTVTKDTMSLVLGVHDRAGTTDTNRQVLTIAEIVLHPSYSPSGSSHDIALLKISETVDLDTWSPACLPTSGADFAGQNGWVYGWGTTSEGGSEGLADKLLELEVPIVSDSVCATAMSSQGQTITSDMLCAGGENGKDACAGDSGGPFTVADSGSGAHTLVGAVSFGIGCAREGLYGVYADVPFFRTWIDETIAAKGGATFCS